MVKNTKDIKAYAYDYPLVDLTIPQIKEIEKLSTEKNLDNNVKQSILELRLQIVELIKDKCEPKDKITLTDKEEAEKLTSLTLQLRDKMLDTFGKDIAAAGGTGSNKLHTYKHVYETLSELAGNNAKVETTLVGAFGEDSLAPLVKHYLDKSGTKTHPDAEPSKSSRVTIVLTLDGEEDRRAVKMPFAIPESGKNYKKQTDLSASGDVFFVEATLIDRFGAKNFIRFAEELNESGKFMAFSPPTEARYLFDAKKGEPIKDNILAFIKAARASNITAMNEEELQRFMGDYDPKKRIESLEDQHFLDAIKALRNNLKGINKEGATEEEIAKYKMPEDHIALVTFGKFGAGAYKPHARKTAPSSPIPEGSIMYKIGAGDAFAAAFTAFITHAKNELGVDLKDNSLKFTEVLNYALTGAAKVATQVILRPETQIDPEIIKSTIREHHKSFFQPETVLDNLKSPQPISGSPSQYLA